MPPQPTFLASGVTPRIVDTRWTLLAKKLAAIQNSLSSPSANNDPKRTDTAHQLQVKIDRAWAGLTSGG